MRTYVVDTDGLAKPFSDADTGRLSVEKVRAVIECPAGVRLKHGTWIDEKGIEWAVIYHQCPDHPRNPCSGFVNGWLGQDVRSDDDNLIRGKCLVGPASELPDLDGLAS